MKRFRRICLLGSKESSYTSSDAVTDFLEALGIWVDESVVNSLLDTQHFSVMADECTDIATIEELSIFCRWEENGSPVATPTFHSATSYWAGFPS